MLLETNFAPLMTLGIKGLFFILLIFFALHAMVLAYHWFAYGSNKATSLLALGVYLAGGAVLLITFAISLGTF